ncbi:protein-tyrosine phosphatase-like protein [Lanmaoa asiatica]|nr:protein-tyrosine phosphatase-like protein [Lanmaoa asiatica]
MAALNLSDEALRNLVQGPGDVEWRQVFFCQATSVVATANDGLASKSLETLKSLSVTHIVCIRDQKEAFSVRPRFPDHFIYLVLDVEDNEEQNVIRLFPEADQFIQQALTQGGKVLVHCNGGISLSPAFVVMFVMRHCQLSWEDALHLVQNRRYCISPNGGFLTQIKEYESIYKAKAAVANFPAAPMQRAVSRRKRDDEEDSRIEDRKRVLVDGDDEDGDDRMMATEP